jgi:hypothetical protein
MELQKGPGGVFGDTIPRSGWLFNSNLWRFFACLWWRIPASVACGSRILISRKETSDPGIP